MKNNKLNILAKMMFFSLVILFVSCKKIDNEEIIYGNAKFKLVNAIEGSATQDFYQGDAKISTTALAYGDISDYLTVKAGNSTIYFKSSNTQTVNATGNIGINTDVKYTVFFAKNPNGSNEITGYPESTAVPPTGRSGVRFVNLSNSLTSPIYVTSNLGVQITTNLIFGNITDYAVIDPALELKFGLTGSLNTTAIPAASFQSGKLYTVWFDASDATTAKYHIVQQN